MTPEEIHRRQFRFAQEKERSRKHHGDRSGARHGGNAFLIRIFQMIGRQCVEARGEACPARIGQLIRMQLHAQACTRGGFEERRRFIRREGDVLAEGVDGRRQALLRDACEGRPRHLRHERLAVDIRGERMQAQKGSHGADLRFTTGTVRGAEQANFRFCVQAIAGLDFDGGHAFRCEHSQAFNGACCKFVIRRRTRRADCRHDAATGPRDVLVGFSLQAHFELCRPVAGKHQVRVAVDQSRRNPAITGVINPVAQVFRPSWQITHGTGEDDPPLADAQRRVFNSPVSAHVFAHRGEACIDEETVPFHACIVSWPETRDNTGGLEARGPRERFGEEQGFGYEALALQFAED